MMSMCLNKSLTATAKASLLTYRAEYTFDGVKYAPLMYKIIMRLATNDNVATTQTLQDNLQNLGIFAGTVKGDIDKINAEFDTNYSQLLARGATLDDPIGILFEAYLLVPCYSFTKYIGTKHDDYLNGNLTGLTHEAMMSMAKRKFDFHKTKGKWGAKSPDNEKSGNDCRNQHPEGPAQAGSQAQHHCWQRREGQRQIIKEKGTEEG